MFGVSKMLHPDPQQCLFIFGTDLDLRKETVQKEQVFRDKILLCLNSTQSKDQIEKRQTQQIVP